MTTTLSWTPITLEVGVRKIVQKVISETQSIVLVSFREHQNVRKWIWKQGSAKQQRALSDPKRTEDAATTVKSESVILDNLSRGLSGGKIERPDKSLEKSATVSIFLSTTFLGEPAYTTHSGLAVLDLFSDIQIPTKKIDDLGLDLVRCLRLPEYLPANTFAIKWHQKWKVAQTKTMKAHSNHILDPMKKTPNGCVYTEVNNHKCQNHPKKRAVVLAYHGYFSKEIHLWQPSKSSRRKIA